MSLPASLRAAVRTAFTQVLARPHIVALLLVVNLGAAWVLTAPLRGLLAAELDHNLYGETMRTEASWRWFDTVERKHPEAVGSFAAWNALFSDEGVDLTDLRELSGPAAAVAVTGLGLFWVNALLHCGFLASLYRDRRGGFGAATAHYTVPVSALTFFALLTYSGVYWLLYVQTGRWLEDLRLAVDSEWAALGLTWGRLLLTLAGLLVIKLLFDLSRVALVDRGTWNWPWAFLVAVRELGRRGGRYTLLYLLLGLAAPLLAALWMLTAGRITPGDWPALLLLFLLQQVFLGARMALRLAHLAATRALYLEARALPEKPPYKVEPAPES